MFDLLKNIFSSLNYNSVRDFILSRAGLAFSGIKGFVVKYLYDQIYKNGVLRIWYWLSRKDAKAKAIKKSKADNVKLEGAKTHEELKDAIRDSFPSE